MASDEPPIPSKTRDSSFVPSTTDKKYLEPPQSVSREEADEEWHSRLGSYDPGETFKCWQEVIDEEAQAKQADE